MKLNFLKASQVLLILGLILLVVSYFVFDFQNLILNLLMYGVLTLGFLLNFIGVLTKPR
ncbi:MAG: hypothetical protein NVV73_01215 [Cellvibrionaceae bacterium]|nr:hypothetical protein [Cellvibrionaceae bacterium]